MIQIFLLPSYPTNKKQETSTKPIGIHSFSKYGKHNSYSLLFTGLSLSRISLLLIERLKYLIIKNKGFKAYNFGVSNSGSSYKGLACNG